MTALAVNYSDFENMKQQDPRKELECKLNIVVYYTDQWIESNNLSYIYEWLPYIYEYGARDYGQNKVFEEYMQLQKLVAGEINAIDMCYWLCCNAARVDRLYQIMRGVSLYLSTGRLTTTTHCLIKLLPHVGEVEPDLEELSRAVTELWGENLSKLVEENSEDFNNTFKRSILFDKQKDWCGNVFYKLAFGVYVASLKWDVKYLDWFKTCMKNSENALNSEAIMNMYNFMRTKDMAALDDAKNAAWSWTRTILSQTVVTEQREDCPVYKFLTECYEYIYDNMFAKMIDIQLMCCHTDDDKNRFITFLLIEEEESIDYEINKLIEAYIAKEPVSIELDPVLPLPEPTEPVSIEHAESTDYSTITRTD